jgi:hypothetical protein
MKRSVQVPVQIRACAAIGLVALMPTMAASDIVISQFFSSGGMSGATYRYDYVELFNAGASPVNVTGWTIHTVGQFIPEWSKAADLSGTIPPGGYYLVQLTGSPQGNGIPLPSPDAVGVGSLSFDIGSLGVFSSNPDQVHCGDVPVDRVAYGQPVCPEGAAMAAIAIDVAALRAGAGCTDTDNNAADFSTGDPAPRNSASPANVCGVSGVPPGGGGSAMLAPPRPSPSSTVTEFAYTLPKDGPVQLAVFDLRGRLVRTLVDGWLPAGTARVTWDGARDDGTAAPAGVYFPALWC